MKCIDCENCKISVDETRYAEAKCLKTSAKGRIITWAYTIYPTYKDLKKGTNKSYGDDRVRAVLERKEKAPSWCPYRKEKSI
jgi:hypothetical protein